VRNGIAHPVPEKPKARATEPNPPRVTLPEFASDEVTDEDLSDELPKKL
jgi:hypothetical protein